MLECIVSLAPSVEQRYATKDSFDQVALWFRHDVLEDKMGNRHQGIGHTRHRIGRSILRPAVFVDLARAWRGADINASRQIPHQTHSLQIFKLVPSRRGSLKSYLTRSSQPGDDPRCNVDHGYKRKGAMAEMRVVPALILPHLHCGDA